MSGKYVKKAVDALYTTLSTGLQAHLTTVETAEGLGAGDLTAPIAYVKGLVSDDNRSPLIQVYATDWSALDQLNELHSVQCMVVLSYASDADLDAAELFVMRYIWAIYATIQADPNLGGEASGAFFTGGVSHAEIGDSSASRHVETLSWDVHVHSV